MFESNLPIIRFNKQKLGKGCIFLLKKKSKQQIKINIDGNHFYREPG